LIQYQGINHRFITTLARESKMHVMLMKAAYSRRDEHRREQISNVEQIEPNLESPQRT
jgi:hypothetical protein